MGLWTAPVWGDVDLPDANHSDPVVISAEAANRWQQGSYEVWLLKGSCRIGQGADLVQCQEAILWIHHAAPTSDQQSKVIALLEGNVTLQFQRQGGPVRVTDQSWFGRFTTSHSVQIQAAMVTGRPDVLPGIYQRGMERRNPEFTDVLRQTRVEQVQYMSPRKEQPMVQPLPPGTRRVRVFPRGDVPVQAQWFPDPQTNQWIAVVDQGVNLIVDGLKGFGSIDVSTDRLVIWTTGSREPDLTGQIAQDQRTPMEIYMEGNIVFRQGERVIYADRMYYDVPNHVGTVLGADVLSPAPRYEGLVRLHAEILQQTGQDRFFAQNAYFTPSRMGSPSYRIQSGSMSFEDNQRPVVDPATGQALASPETGQPLVEHDRLVTAQNNLLYVGELPIFYWPMLATDLNEPTFYLRRIRFKQDKVFGTQILTNWNMYQLLGIHRPPTGTDWDLSLDYLSKRGFGHGMSYLYHRDQFFDIPGPMAGMADYWGIFDNGFDNLGINRSHVIPDVDYRYRFLWQHRQQLPEGFKLSAEVGKISDRNFLEEFYKREWDELKDQTTDVELKRTYENRSLSLFAQARLNDFFTETQWLPRADHYWLGESLLGDKLTWHEHSSVGYAQFRIASLPDTAAGDQAAAHLPWELQNRQGERLVTRNELDLPLQLGPVKIVPYALGELGHWGEDVAGNQVNRAYYQAGIRSSMPMWSVDPTVESALWNVHGLAHKVEFEAEYSHSQSNRHIDDTPLPLYDPLDDNQIEAFRRRFFESQYGGVASPAYQRVDERFYALRTGMAGWVTAPGMEIADDLDALRLGINQRWQTKRGMPDNRHIVDWVELNTHATFYPDPNRDNFGEVMGLLDYDFRWHVGDRLTVVSDGIFDFFTDGQRLVNVGAFLTRPPRGALYAGFRLLDGPITNHILTFSYSYWMSPKWISSMGFSIDLSETKNMGETIRITRVGESLLVSAAFSVDPARNSVGANFSVEPRFLPKGTLGQVPGVHVPVAGAFGLE